jgi:hypothetical protein
MFAFEMLTSNKQLLQFIANQHAGSEQPSVSESAKIFISLQNASASGPIVFLRAFLIVQIPFLWLVYGNVAHFLCFYRAGKRIQQKNDALRDVSASTVRSVSTKMHVAL